MNSQAAENAFLHAQKLSPYFVAKDADTSEDVLIGFAGKASPATANSVLSFQASLFRELGCLTRLVKITDGCFECSFSFQNPRQSEHLATQIEGGKFNGLAYRYRVIFVRFLSSPKLDEYHFERDSLFR